MRAIPNVHSSDDGLTWLAAANEHHYPLIFTVGFSISFSARSTMMLMPCSRPQLLFLPPQASFPASALPVTMLPLQLLISNKMSPHNHTLVCGCSFQRYKHQEANLTTTVVIQAMNAVSNTICIPKCKQQTHLIIFGINVIPGVSLFGSTANLRH